MKYIFNILSLCGVLNSIFLNKHLLKVKHIKMSSHKILMTFLTILCDLKQKMYIKISFCPLMN